MTTFSPQVADKKRLHFWPMNELIHHPRQYLLTFSKEVASEKLP
jgi:hypothetical protein